MPVRRQRWTMRPESYLIFGTFHRRTGRAKMVETFSCIPSCSAWYETKHENQLQVHTYRSQTIGSNKKYTSSHVSFKKWSNSMCADTLYQEWNFKKKGLHACTPFWRKPRIKRSIVYTGRPCTTL